MARLNTIACSDCLDFLRKLPDNSIDLVVSDPPYEIQTRGAGMYKAADKGYVAELDEMKDGFSEEVLVELCRVMKKINIYLFCSQKQIIPLLNFFVRDRACNYNLLTWHKSNPIPACGNKYITDTEFIMFFRERGVRIFGSAQTKKTYYVTPLNVADKRKYGHPTVKPVEIVENLILNSCPSGGVVLDPFAGSGTTAEAAIRTGNNYLCCEINPRWVAVAENRLALL